VREAARKDGDLKFTALLHHADVDALRSSFSIFKFPDNLRDLLIELGAGGGRKGA
jgi:hypothetical protein